MNKLEDLEIYARKQGYDVVQVTDGLNGYPRNLHYAAIGFEDIEEAEKLAKATGGEVVTLRRRDGHQFYTEEGWTYKPFDLISIFSEFDSIAGIFTKEDLNTQYLNDYLDYLNESEAEKLLCTIRGLEQNQFVLLWNIFNGKANYEVLPIITMRYSYDVYTYVIGVADRAYLGL